MNNSKYEHLVYALITILLIAFTVVSCEENEEDNESELGANTDSDSGADAGDLGTDEDEANADAGDPGTDGEVADAGEVESSDGSAFGESCSGDEQCADGQCHEFGQLGWVCTIPCENHDQCPEGSEGKKCNQQSVCRP